MKKNIILALSIITTLNIHAMHEEPMDIEENQPVQQLPCYLAMLPMDILDYIAHFLIFDDIESEEEFIERTKIKSNKSPESYIKYLPKFEWGMGLNGTLIGCCPNETKVALLSLLCGTGATPALTIIDEEKDELLHQTPLCQKNYQHIALSRGANMLATIDEDRKVDDTPGDTEEMEYSLTYFLTVKNTASQKTERLEIPDIFLPGGPTLSSAHTNTSMVLAFKKEGTHIIVRGLNYILPTTKDFPSNPMPHHMIFPVTINESPVLSKKTLQHYFAQKKVCKSITDNNKLTTTITQ